MSGTYVSDGISATKAEDPLSSDMFVKGLVLRTAKNALGVSGHSVGLYDSDTECAGTRCLSCIGDAEAVTRIFIGVPLCV